jgi:hypothetical protein
MNNEKKTFFLSLFLLSCVAIVSTYNRNGQRAPASLGIQFKNQVKFDFIEKYVENDQHDFSLAEYDLKDGQRLILIGLNKSLNQYSFNAKDLGFRELAGDITKIDPKFLISLNKRGVQRVYTFEYGNSSKRRLKEAMESSKSHRLYYLKDKSSDRVSRLPRLLLDVREVKSRKKWLGYLKSAMSLVGYSPFAYIKHTFDQILKVIEIKMYYQASYLSQLVEKTLTQDMFPELVKAIGKDELLQIGSSLRLRYRQENSVLTTYNITNLSKIQLYKDYLKIKNEIFTENISKLVERGNEEGLIVVPLATDLAIVYYDLNSHINPEEYDGALLDNRKLERYYKKYKDQIKDENALVALGLFTMGNPNAPNEVIDFNHPNQNLHRERIRNLSNYAVNLSLSFIPYKQIKTVLSWSKKAIKFSLTKSGRNIYTSHIFSEAQLAAILDSGTLDLESNELIINAVMDQVKELNIDPELIVQYRTILLSDASADDKREVMEGIYLHFSDFQTGNRTVSGLSGQYRFVNKMVAWKKLTRYLDNPARHKEIKRFLKEREKNTKNGQRYPSSIGETWDVENPVIMFFIAGLQEKDLKLGLSKNIIPNIKKYFIEKGISYDTFTEQSLSIPSLATILTGVEMDQHGLRSNTPVSRLVSDDNTNYIDPRKDIIVPKYFRKSRSYRHIEASGYEWFFKDLGTADEMVLNFIPIYEGGATPIGDYLVEAYKDMTKIFFGNFSHSIIIDKASAAQAARKIKKSKGDLNLVVNWYTCLDNFKRLSNKAIIVCLSELDKSIGKVIEASKKDKRLQNADLYIISEGGYKGGLITHNGKEKFLNNTGLNLTKFFAGDYNSHANYNFVISTYESPTPDYDLKFLQEYYIQPFDYIYKGKHKDNKGKPVVKIDFYGDGQARLYFKNLKKGWKHHNNYYELSKYEYKLNPKNKFSKTLKVNIIDDLLSMTLRNTSIVDSSLRKHIKKTTGNRPVKFIAYPLVDQKFQDYMIEKSETFFNRTAVLLKGLKYQALVLSRNNGDGGLEFMYLPIKDFTQNSKGEYSLSTDTESDLLGLLKNDLCKKKTWYKEREFIQTHKNNEFTTMLAHFSRVFFFSEPINGNLSRVGERPDIILYANDGFNFNSAHKTEADQGHYTSDVTSTVFYHSSLRSEPLMSDKAQSKLMSQVFLTRDIAPYILFQAFGKRKSSNWKPNWNELNNVFEILKEE